MPISVLTAMEIQSNGNKTIRCEAIRDRDIHKWSGRINYYRRGQLHKVMVSTDFVFDTKEQAITHMQNVVKQIRKTELK
jgi:hypothetical protein